MKIAVASDVHLEFGQLEIENTKGAEVLCLCGDICVAHDLLPVEESTSQDHKSKTFHEFFQQCSNQFPHVLYIMGNHEHYHGDFAKSYETLKSNLSYLPNIHVLDKEHIDIGDITFFGATLWTDMNKGNEDTLRIIKGMMNDFRIISNSDNLTYYRVQDYEAIGMGYTEYADKKLAGEAVPEIPMKTVTRPSTFTPIDARAEHAATLAVLDELVESRPLRKFVVLGHHAPSKRSTKPRYEADVHMNGGYSSDLVEFIKEHPQIVLWLHGHSHNKFDYVEEGCRIYANPRGYIGYEYEASDFKLEFLDV